MGVRKPRFGLTDEELEARPLIFAPALFDGQVVLVSGGGSGIGRAIAWIYARLGAVVVICGRSPDKLESVAAAAAACGHKIEGIATDIREPDQVNGLIESIWDRHGRLDHLINNAGGQFPQAAIDFSKKGWDSVIDTNLSGTWHMMQAAARRWRDEGRPGNVVNIITVVPRGMPGVAHTIAARAGVVGLTNTVAIEWAEHDIRVNCVAPGPIETEGLNVYPEEALAKIDRSNPMKRAGDAFDVADACIYLSAESGKFVTGTVLTVDGGYHLWGELWLAGKPAYFDE